MGVLSKKGSGALVSEPRYRGVLRTLSVQIRPAYLKV
nr:MAG TPA: hypothetical protein [Caudoviricetes sp.]